MSAPASKAYRLKSYGQLDVRCVQQCLSLFKAHAVNIRKLILLKEAHPLHFSHLEIDFTLLESGLDGQAFLAGLEQRFADMRYTQYAVVCLD